MKVFTGFSFKRSNRHANLSNTEPALPHTQPGAQAQAGAQLAHFTSNRAERQTLTACTRKIFLNKNPMEKHHP
jgi:hypothetical protein